MKSDKRGRWQRDYEIAEPTGLSVSFLRKDRIGRQFIPFHRVGRSCLYDLDEVQRAIELARVGGKAA